MEQTRRQLLYVAWLRGYDSDIAPGTGIATAPAIVATAAD